MPNDTEAQRDERPPEHASAGGGDGRLGRLPGGPLTALGGLVLVLVAVLALREIASLVVPVLFGLFIALVVSPLVTALERRGIRHVVALSVAIAVVLAMVLATAGVIALSIGELVVQVPRYESRMRELFDQVQEILAGLGFQADSNAISAVVSPEDIVGYVRPVASAVSRGAAAILILAFTLAYALLGAPGLRARAVVAFGEHHAMLRGVEQFGVDLRRYLIVRAQLGLFAAVLTLVLLLVLGVPLPVLWSFLVFAAAFIPNIGTFLALIPPMILALLEGGVGTAAAVIIGFALINAAQDYLLQPRMMGTELNLSPLVVFLSVIVWAWILGAAGALLAVPLTVGLVAILEAFPDTRGMAALLRDRIEAPPVLMAAAATGGAAGTGEGASDQGG
jgi:AI-2 transport protein TqsA